MWGSSRRVLFNLGFAGTIAAFFGLSALAHFAVIGPAWGATRRNFACNATLSAGSSTR